MNLLGAKNYDPAGAVSKVTTSLLAQTAIDTTNLRIAFTVPSHGMVLVKMSCVHHGSTTVAQVLLGVLEGSTVRGRQHGNIALLQTAVATSMVRLDVSFIVTGLTPGAVNWDASYGVEIVASANGAIKYGGPNNTTTNDAFGGFNFEIWDPQPQTTTGQLSVDANGRVDVIKVAGTTQTAGDIPALINTLDDYVDTEVSAIKAKTDNLPSDPADASDIAASFTTVNGKLDTIDDFLDTEIAAIKAKTDNLPSDPADASDIATLFTTVNGKLDTIDDFLDTEIAAIKAKTDNLPSDPADESLLEAAIAAVQADTNDIQARLPAALSGDGFMKADLKSIEDELTSGNNATLKLEKLSIVNNDVSGVGIEVQAGSGNGISIFGSQSAMSIVGDTSDAIEIIANAAHALGIYGTTDGIQIESISGKSINAPNDIAVSDGDLTLTAIEDAIWDATLADHQDAGSTGEALGDAGAAGDPWGTALPGAYGAGTAGKIVGDNINATISSRASQSSLDTLDDYVDTEVAAIKAKTDNLPSDPADESSIQAAIAAVQADTNDIQSRLPAALSGDGFIKSDLKSIDDETTDGNNATLNLKKLDIRSTDGDTVFLFAEGDAFHIETQGNGSAGVNIISQQGTGVYIEGDGTAAHGVDIRSAEGKSINAPQDIAISDGDLTLAAIAAAVWSNTTRTLTAISDSTGITTLLARIASALNISGGAVDANITSVIGDPVQENGVADTNWGGTP